MGQFQIDPSFVVLVEMNGPLPRFPLKFRSWYELAVGAFENIMVEKDVMESEPAVRKKQLFLELRCAS